MRTIKSYIWDKDEELAEYQRREAIGEFLHIDGHILFNPLIEIDLRYNISEETVLEKGQKIRLVEAYNRLKHCNNCVERLLGDYYKYEFNDRADLPHRKIFWINWQLKGGSMLKAFGKTQIMRICQSPLCVKVEHLVTHRPESSILRGSQHGRSKLTEEQVTEIRQLKAEKDLSYAELGRMFGISGIQANRICKGKSRISNV